MMDRLFSLSVALVLAGLIWLYASSREQEMLDNVLISVQINLPPHLQDHYSLEVNGLAQVPVSFTGPASRMRELRSNLQRGELHVTATLRVPDDHLQDARYQDTIRVESGDVPVPPGVTPILIEGRNRIPVTLRRLVERRLPVRLDHGTDDRVGRAVIEPPTVLVRGPQEVLDHMESIATQPFALPTRPEGLVPETVVVGPIPLVEQFEKRPVRVTPESVQVRLTLQPRRKPYEIEVPIHFLCPPNFPRRPRFRTERDAKVTVRLIGPTSEESPRIFAYIDLTAPGKFASSSPYYDEPLQVQLPPGFQLAQPLPRFGAFELAPSEGATLGATSP